MHTGLGYKTAFESEVLCNMVMVVVRVVMVVLMVVVEMVVMIVVMVMVAIMVVDVLCDDGVYSSFAAIEVSVFLSLIKYLMTLV